MDLQETPATPPERVGGDERIGWWISGAVLVGLGWVLGVVVNLVFHYLARSAPFTVLGVHFGGTLGPFAWAVFGLGVVTGALGVAILGLAHRAERGPFVLPGADY